jgi:hypothetical protein
MAQEVAEIVAEAARATSDGCQKLGLRVLVGQEPSDNDDDGDTGCYFIGDLVIEAVRRVAITARN